MIGETLGGLRVDRMTTVKLHPTPRETFGPFTVRYYAPHAETDRTILVLDDDLIGDAAISACRARSIDGTIKGVKLALIGFNADAFATLHQLRGEYLTHQERDLGFVGMEKTGRGQTLQSFIMDEFLPDLGERVSLLGYSLSGAFAINLFAGPDAFEALGLVSPTLWLNPSLEDRLCSAATRLDRCSVALAVGECETEDAPGGGKSMFERLDELSEKLAPVMGDRFQYTLGSHDDHTSVITSTMDRVVTALAAGSKTRG